MMAVHEWTLPFFNLVKPHHLYASICKEHVLGGTLGAHEKANSSIHVNATFAKLASATDVRDQHHKSILQHAKSNHRIFFKMVSVLLQNPKGSGLPTWSTKAAMLARILTLLCSADPQYAVTHRPLTAGKVAL